MVFSQGSGRENAWYFHRVRVEHTSNTNRRKVITVGGINRSEWHMLAGARCIACRDVRGDPMSSVPSETPEILCLRPLTILWSVARLSEASWPSPVSTVSNKVTPEFLLMAAATQPPDRGAGRGTQMASENFGSFVLSTPSHLQPSRLDASCTSHTCTRLLCNLSRM